MSEREKAIVHIKKQNHRIGKIVKDAFLPLFVAILFSSPFLAFGFSDLRAVPSEPVEVVFSKCKWELSFGHSALYFVTDHNEYFLLPGYLRTALNQDAENGVLQPGSVFTVTKYNFLWQTRIATAECGDTVYADMDDWKADNKKDIINYFTISGFIIVPGMILSIIMLYLSRTELREIRKFKRKYKERL